VDEPIDKEYAAVVLAAVEAVKRSVLGLDLTSGYIPRRNVPEYKVNEFGWPSITRTYFGSSTSGPLNWGALVGKKGGTGSVRFDTSDIPELRSVIDFLASRPDIWSKVAGLSSSPADEAVAAQLREFDAVRIVTSVAERSDATGEDPKAVFLQLEQGQLAPTLSADLLVPIALVRLDLPAALELDNDVWIEPLEEVTQRARAIDLHGGSNGVNAFLVSAATHAVVLRNRTFDNARGALVRRILMDLRSTHREEIEQVFQAIEIVSGQRVGYAQICLRPHGWADEWVADLPPLETVATVSRVPVEVQEHGWNATPILIEKARLEELPSRYAALRRTQQRAQLAARRLFQSSLRSTSDDALLDACIGIEALLGEEHDELVHRMGLRASVALVPHGWRAERAYEMLKKVYAHRSKIVHGTEPKNATISIDGKSYSTVGTAVFLLRALMQSHLAASPTWTPGTLDGQLTSAIDTYLGPEPPHLNE
jgi:hypothetical protein